MKSPKKIRLLKDLVIPAGTVFDNCDGHTKKFVSGNYETTIGLSKDSSGSLVYGFEPMDGILTEWFEEVK